MAAPFRKSKNVENTGFSNNSSAQGARFANKDGSPNVIKAGLPLWQRISLFHTLIRIKGWKFLLIVFGFYTITNITFALLYLAIGVENLQGVTADETNPLNGFQQAFFFSSQTLTTVGYGHISPVGLKANVVASLESFVGILSFAMVTGLLY